MLFRSSFWGEMPLVGRFADANGYEMLIVTIREDVVQNVVFRKFSEKDQEWVKDYNWK